jgi:hypothetical protein
LDKKNIPSLSKPYKSTTPSKINFENMGTEKSRNNGYNFFVKYSHQLEEEKKKLLIRIRSLEEENQLLTQRFRGSIDQREKIKASADQVMDMLGYLNGLIDKFVRPNGSKMRDSASNSQKALLMDTLCQEKRRFDHTFLGLEDSLKSVSVSRESGKLHHPVQNQKRLYGEEVMQIGHINRNHRIGDEGPLKHVLKDEYYQEDTQDNREVSKKENMNNSKSNLTKSSMIQNELNQSIQNLHKLTNEVEKQVEEMEHNPYTIEIGAQELDSLSGRKKHKKVYLSEDRSDAKNLINLHKLSKIHATEKTGTDLSSKFKSKGRREKVNISIDECNRLFLETLPNSKKRYKSKRRKSRRPRNKTMEPRNFQKQGTRKTLGEDNDLSIDSNIPYQGLYNRHNSFFNRNRSQINCKSRETPGSQEVNVWDRYNMNLPQSGSSKDSRSATSHVKRYENSRFTESLDRRTHEDNQSSTKTQNTNDAPLPKVEFGVLKEKKLLHVKEESLEEGQDQVPEAEVSSNVQEKINYLRPTDSLRHR